MVVNITLCITLESWLLLKNKEDLWFYNSTLFGIVAIIIMFLTYPFVMLYYFYFMGMCTGCIIIFIIEKEKKITNV